MATKAERLSGTICICLLFGLIIVIWAAYGITDATSQDTYECPDPFTPAHCVVNPNQDLPGGGALRLTDGVTYDPKYSTSPWSIGQRDCFWFSCKPERCALPALFSEAKDLCIDMISFKDQYGDDCIDWTRYITGTNALWSPRKDGTDPKCNTIPPHKPRMTTGELSAMKSACCICGGGLIDRDYAGPKILPDKSIQPPPPVTVPEQHKGKTPTHLTQCCACWDEAVKRAKIGKSAAEIEAIDENKKIYNNPRGGTLTCQKPMEKDFDKRRDLLTPFVIAASVITVFILLCMFGIGWCFEVTIPTNGSAENEAAVKEALMSKSTPLPFLVKL